MKRNAERLAPVALPGDAIRRVEYRHMAVTPSRRAASPAVAAGPDASADVRRFWKLAREGESGGNPYPVLLGLKPLPALDLARAVRRGVSYASVVRLQEAMELSPGELSGVVGIPPRTLDRRRKEGRLDADESDRALRLSRVFGAAVALFEGDAVGARRWLGEPHPALGGDRPIELLRTEVGALEVERLLGRLEHGIVS